MENTPQTTNHTTELQNTIKQSFSFCRNCPLKKECMYTRDVYKTSENEVEQSFLKGLDKYNGQFSDGLYKEYNKIQAREQFEKRKGRLVDEQFAKHVGDQTCKYESQLTEQTATSLIAKYDISQYPEAVYIIEQIIKLRLHDLRLALLHKEHGIAKEMVARDGTPLGIKLTPGLHYSVEISAKVGQLIQQLNQMVDGQKINIEGHISIKDFINKIIDIK